MRTYYQWVRLYFSWKRNLQFLHAMSKYFLKHKVNWPVGQLVALFLSSVFTQQNQFAKCSQIQVQDQATSKIYQKLAQCFQLFNNSSGDAALAKHEKGLVWFGMVSVSFNFIFFLFHCFCFRFYSLTMRSDVVSKCVLLQVTQVLEQFSFHPIF